MRHLLLLSLLFVGGGCRYLSTGAGPVTEGPSASYVPPTSSLHYRSFADADALAQYLAWRPGAPVLLSAHRGGPSVGYPENALATFERALNYAPVLIECDVRATADGRLVLLHDETLERTTTGTGPLVARTFEQVRALRLLDTESRPTPHRIPSLDEVLAWAEGRAILMLDVKPGVAPVDLVAAVRRAGAANRVAVITYSTSDWLAYVGFAPDLVYSVDASTPEAANEVLQYAAGHVIAFAGVGVPDAAIVERLHARGIRVQAATFGEPDSAAVAGDRAAYARFLSAGVDVLATDEVTAAAPATRPAGR